MTAGLIGILLLLMPTAHAQGGWFSRLCEKLLIVGDAPYQYETYTTDELVGAYFRYQQDRTHVQTVIAEMRKRLGWDLTDEDREILTKTLNNEEYQ